MKDLKERQLEIIERHVAAGHFTYEDIYYILMKRDDDVACIYWTTDDVLHVAEDEGVAISKDQARAIIDELEHNHDAEYGINWDAIRGYVRDMVKPTEEHDEGF